MSPGVPVVSMVTPRQWVAPVCAVSVMVTLTSTRQAAVTVLLGSVYVVSATQQENTVSCVSLVTMEMLCMPRTVRVSTTVIIYVLSVFDRGRNTIT